MTHHKNLLILVAFFLLCSFASAQANFQQDQRQMHQHNMATQNNMRLHEQFEDMDMMSYMTRPTNKYSGKYRFNIVMLNGDTIFNNKKTSISLMEPLKEIVLKENKEEQEFTPAQTKEIFVTDDDEFIRGIQHEDYWIFNTHSSPDVEFYAPFPDDNITYITHFRTMGDTIKELTIEDLEEIVKDHPKALKDTKKKKAENALQKYLKEEEEEKKE